MNMLRVRTIVEKEWAEVFKNKLVLFTVGFLPLIFTVLPLGILYATGSDPEMAAGEMSDVPAQFMALCGDIPAAECMQVFILNQFLLLFMMMPLIIPVSIAAYSIVGEKTTRSLEPLLATPISTVELLTAKSLAAAIPAVLATWLGFTLFILGAPLVSTGPSVLRYILSPMWLLEVFGLGPLMAIMAVNFAIMVSSRVTDPRVAEQMAAVIIVPLLAIMFGQIGGLLILNLNFMLISAVVLLAADAALIVLGARLFQRETILTKWK